MVTHIVAWNLRPEIAEGDRALIRENAKKGLEGLAGKVPGLLSAVFIDRPLAGSNRDMALITTHTDADALASYAKDPQHNAVADRFVRPFTCERVSMNFQGPDRQAEG